MLLRAGQPLQGKVREMHTDPYTTPWAGLHAFIVHLSPQSCRCPGLLSEAAFDRVMDALNWRMPYHLRAFHCSSPETAAAAAWDGLHGSNTLDAATIVKLTRTLAIIPITLVLSFWQMRKAKKSGEAQGGTFDIKKIFPFFILFFILASVVTTVFALPATVTAPIKELSKFFIIMAMAAIGFNTNLVKLVRTGGKPIFMGLCCWIGIAGVSLLIQHVLGIW